MNRVKVGFRVAAREVILALALASLGTVLAPATGLAATVPPVLQAHIFKKVLSLTPDFAKQKKLVVAYTTAKSDAVVLQKAFSGLGFDTKLVKDYGLITQDAELVYLVESSEDTDGFCNKKRVLCLSGSVSAVSKGHAEVAVGSRRNKPKIFLNLKRINLKGIKIRQELVQLAEIVDE